MRAQQWEEIAPDVSETLELPGVLKEMQAPTPSWNDRDTSIAYTLWLFNIAMENGPFIDYFPIKTSIYKGFSMAMLNNQISM